MLTSNTENYDGEVTKILTEPAEFPNIGDVLAGFLTEIDTEDGDLDLLTIFFAEGRIFVDIEIGGSRGEFNLEDILSLLQLMNERIVESSPVLAQANAWGKSGSHPNPYSSATTEEL